MRIFTDDLIHIRLAGLRRIPYMILFHIQVIGFTAGSGSCCVMRPFPLKLGFGGNGDIDQPLACLKSGNIEILLGVDEFFFHRGNKGFYTGCVKETLMMPLFGVKETFPALTAHGLHPRPLIPPGKIG